MKCKEAMRLLEDQVAALSAYVAATNSLRQFKDPESAEYYRATQTAKAAKEACSWHAWNLRKHRQKHRC